MRRIPDELRREMERDPFYKRCCLSLSSSGKIDWHHALIFAGRQVNAKFAILPLRTDIHARVHEPKIKKLCDWVMLNRASAKELKQYSKVTNLARYREQLNEEYGVWNPRQMRTVGML